MHGFASADLCISGALSSYRRRWCIQRIYGPLGAAATAVNAPLVLGFHARRRSHMHTVLLLRELVAASVQDR